MHEEVNIGYIYLTDHSETILLVYPPAQKNCYGPWNRRFRRTRYYRQWTNRAPKKSLAPEPRSQIAETS